MKIIVAESYDEMSALAASEIASVIENKPNCVLGLATGTTPIGLYSNLVARYEASTLSFAQCTSFNLDEYCGLEGTHPQSYRYFMNVNLFDHVDIDKEKTFIPAANTDDVIDGVDAYDAAIAAAGGVDIQLLGIGHNGHIGFNEPADAFDRQTHRIELTEMTRQANSRLFNSIDEVPTHARTMGIGTIMKAHRLLLVASGADKAQIVRDALCGPVTPQVPASILQFHPDVVVVLDKEAAALL